MSNRPTIDETGKVFGSLTVVERVPQNRFFGGRVRAAWLCRCACGEELTVTGLKLRRGEVTECRLCRERRRREEGHDA